MPIFKYQSGSWHDSNVFCCVSVKGGNAQKIPQNFKSLIFPTIFWLQREESQFINTFDLLIPKQITSKFFQWNLKWLHLFAAIILFAQSAWAVEYTKCTSAEECSGYDTKQYDGEVPVMLELWGMRCTSSLPLFPGPLWLGMVAPDRSLSTG